MIVIRFLTMTGCRLWSSFCPSVTICVCRTGCSQRRGIANKRNKRPRPHPVGRQRRRVPSSHNRLYDCVSFSIGLNGQPVSPMGQTIQQGLLSPFWIQTISVIVYNLLNSLVKEGGRIIQSTCADVETSRTSDLLTLLNHIKLNACIKAIPLLELRVCA